MQPERDVTITARLSPQLRYALELLTRIQRRSNSDVIRWAIKEMLVKEVGDLLETVWDVDPEERIRKLAATASQLLTYEEAVFLKGEKEKCR